VPAERRQRIRQVFATVADLPAQEREAELRRQCGDDHTLRSGVERLLLEHDRIEDPEETLLSPGEIVGGRFRVRRLIGTGGMGEVYLCDDPELGLPVALKALKQRAAASSDAAVRFRREISLARLVTHPNVCRVHDIGRHHKGADAIDFFTMEFVDGETLAAYLEREVPLSPAEAAPLVEQMAAGLAALHANKVIHRDLKPSNVLLSKNAAGDLRVVLTDFGIAGTIGANVPGGSFATVSGQILGTPDYMAPEQLTGFAAGPATDLFAFGMMLYEMLTGEKPFPDPTHRMATPIPPQQHRPEIPESWDRLILGCLDPEAAKRPQTVDAVFDVLGAIPRRIPASDAPTIALRRQPMPRRRAAWMWAALLAALLALVGIGSRFFEQGPARPESRRIAVLPFAVAAGNAELKALADGLTDAVTSRLSQYEGLNDQLLVVPASEVRKVGVGEANAARGALGVNYAVEGRVTAQDDRIRLTLTLIDTERMLQEETAVVNGDRARALDLEDNAVRRLATLLDLHALPSQIDSIGSMAPGAEEFYLQGKGYLQRSDELASVNTAIQLFEKAIALDPHYARAYAGLSQAYLYKHDRTEDPAWVAEAARASGRAVEMSPQSLEAQTSHGYALLAQGRHEEGRRSFERALEANTRSAEAYAGLAKSYAERAEANADEAERAAGRKAAEAAYSKAISLRPNDWVAYKQLGMFYYSVGRYADAVREYEMVVELAPDNAHAYNNLGVLHIYLGDREKAKQYLEKTIQIDPNRVSAMANLATLLFEGKQYEAAAGLYERALARNPESPFAWASLADAYRKLGRNDEARRNYEKAILLLNQRVAVEGESVEVHALLAHHFAALGEFDKGREHALRAVSSDSATDQISIAVAFSLAGDEQAARAAVERALATGAALDSIRGIESLAELLPKTIAEKEN
jgi:serine/threonine-protein kinase